jgi:hypothetical protein
VTLRVARLDSDLAETDAEATWLLGHTQYIDFGRLYHDAGAVYVHARLRVPCRYFRAEGATAACAALGYQGSVAPLVARPQVRRDNDSFHLVTSGKLNRAFLTRAKSLPILEGPNPCDGAPCRTADNTKGSACCRDLQVEILCGREDAALEALIRSRQSPYLCKISRESNDSLDGEMISACGYLDEAGKGCTLHGLLRPDGRQAKPGICFDWPEAGDMLHPGCVFRGRLAAHG